MALYLTETDVHHLLVPREVTDELEEVFGALARGQAAQEPRVRVRHGRHVLHNLPALSEVHGMAGIKSYLSGPAGVRFVTLLFGLESGALEAVIESARLGQLRTGCATALAARFLAPPGPRILGLVGTGTVAWGQLEALHAEGALEEVRVFGRDPGRLERFCERAREELQVPARPCASAEEAVGGATLVVTATTSREPVVRGEMLAPVCHVSAVGSNQAGRREVDEALVRSCGCVAVDDVAQARAEAGDLLLAGGFDWASVRTLADLVREGSSHPRPPRTLFKSVGVGLEDVATGALALRKALRAGRGLELPGPA